MLRHFPGSPVARTPCFHCMGHRFDPWSGTKIRHAVQQGQKKKKTLVKYLMKYVCNLLSDGHEKVY